MKAQEATIIEPIQAQPAGPRQIDPQLLSQLRSIVDEAGLLLGADVHSRHPGVFMSRIEADALIRPTTTEQVSRILALCNEYRQPVVVQGGMSGWVRATQTRPGDLALSLERMNRIESVDTANRTAVVQIGRAHV